ncbi:MAG: hypothetical protein HZC36_09735 [Armatimonadetes bacterium]|nr:hypothetical protein [Armatimonadota bacterium]
MILTFVDSHSGEAILREYEWELPVPREGDVLELHSGSETRYVVQEVDWVFADAPAGEKTDVPMKELKIMVVSAAEFVHRGEDGGHRMVDPLCKCGHAKSVHTSMRCNGAAGTCQCHGFESMS